MTKLFAAIAILAVLMGSASAQMGGGRQRGSDQRKSAPKAPKVDDKAYKAALDRIPDSKAKVDPWSNAR